MAFCRRIERFCMPFGFKNLLHHIYYIIFLLKNQIKVLSFALFATIFLKNEHLFT